MPTPSVVVIGAGPSGSASAIELCRNGYRVTLIDKAEHGRDKCCGDGLTSSALRHLEHLGFDPEMADTWTSATTVTIVSPARRSRRFSVGNNEGIHASIVSRRELDAGLVNLAGAAGAEVRFKTRAEGIEVRHDRVNVTTSTGTIEADWCVAADGMWSPTRKALGIGARQYRGDWHAFRQYFDDVGAQARTDMFIWFEPDILPGYMWSFPLGAGRANVGFGVLRSKFAIGEMGQQWNLLLDRPHIAEVLGPKARSVESLRAWPIPARPGNFDLTAHRVLFVGDAAGVCDPLTGEGIGQALETGIAAAAAISQSDQPAEVARRYRSTVLRGLEVDMGLAKSLGTVMASRLGAEGALRLVGSCEWTRRNFARWLLEVYPRAQVFTPWRWKPGALSWQGSYAR